MKTGLATDVAKPVFFMTYFYFVEKAFAGNLDYA